MDQDFSSQDFSRKPRGHDAVRAQTDSTSGTQVGLAVRSRTRSRSQPVVHRRSDRRSVKRCGRCQPAPAERAMQEKKSSRTSPHDRAARPSTAGGAASQLAVRERQVSLAETSSDERTNDMGRS
ncbi:hypothetical protein CSOJ01_01121 [Colletotrichum sojae]|uniref:Uncharacterized protein n=1 Tax=Colletotrichum sojae TaxID=2175907 RepID=A0A8H6JUQ0_9PEZI|nr:hypothetical protein CSOJ01_01121 [Colletotrichum sojae]